MANPYYQSQAEYPPDMMPPPGYYAPPRRGPGGLPTDRASVDVRAFIPAQYEHLRVHPGWGMAIVVGSVATVLYLLHDKRKNRAS